MTWHKLDREFKIRLRNFLTTQVFTTPSTPASSFFNNRSHFPQLDVSLNLCCHRSPVPVFCWSIDCRGINCRSINCRSIDCRSISCRSYAIIPTKSFIGFLYEKSRGVWFPANFLILISLKTSTWTYTFSLLFFIRLSVISLKKPFYL